MGSLVLLFLITDIASEDRISLLSLKMHALKYSMYYSYNNTVQEYFYVYVFYVETVSMRGIPLKHELYVVDGHSVFEVF